SSQEKRARLMPRRAPEERMARSVLVVTATTNLQKAFGHGAGNPEPVRKVQGENRTLRAALNNIENIVHGEQTIQLAHTFHMAFGGAGKDVLRDRNCLKVSERVVIVKYESAPVQPIIQTQSKSEASQALQRVSNRPAPGEEVEIARAIRSAGA